MGRLFAWIVGLLALAGLAVYRIHLGRVRAEVDGLAAVFLRGDDQALARAEAAAVKAQGENAVSVLLGMTAKGGATPCRARMAQRLLRVYLAKYDRRRLSRVEAIVEAAARDLDEPLGRGDAAELEAALGDGDACWRLAACDALRRRPEVAKKLAEPLLEITRGDPTPRVRAGAAAALAAAGERRVVEAVGKAHLAEGAMGVRFVDALAALPGDAGRTALEAALAAHPARAAGWLASRGDAAALAALDRVPTRGDEAERMALVAARARLGSADAVAQLVEAMGPGPDAARLAALAASGPVRGAAVTAAQLTAANSGPDAVRLAAIRALGENPDPGAARGLRALLTETDAARLLAAVEAIAQRGDVAFEDDLIEQLRVGDSDRRVAAIGGLVRMRARDVVPDLRRRLEDPDTTPSVRRACWLGIRDLTGIAPPNRYGGRAITEVVRPRALPE